MADLVPVLGLTEVFDWKRPAAFAADPVQGALTLSFRVFFTVLAVWFVAHLFRDQVDIKPDDVDSEPSASVAERALVEEMVEQGRLLADPLRFGPLHPITNRLLDRACGRLTASRVPPVPPHERWSRASLLDAIAAAQLARAIAAVGSGDHVAPRP
jgi:hypothetical protein